MEEKSEHLPGWGQSALTRCISPINREVLLAQYEQASLDDMPAPGFAMFKNVNEQKLIAAVAKMKESRDRDDDVFGRLVMLYGLAADQPSEIVITQFQKEFGGFDPEKIF
jgi:hypothetical protein